MRQTTLLIALAALVACGGQREAEPAAQAPPPAPDAAGAASPDASPAGPAPQAGGGSLRVDRPAEGTISFAGFGPARFGAESEQVRIGWGGDLGDARPSEPGGCYYLVPQPMGAEGYRTAFMIEGERFVRIDVRDASVTAPGGARVGMTVDEVRALYPALEEQPHKYDPAGKVLRVADPGGGEAALVLEVDAQGRVDEWRVGLPPQVDYVEGCS